MLRDSEAANRWNSLPEEIVSSKGVNALKNKCDGHIFIDTWE